MEGEKTVAMEEVKGEVEEVAADVSLKDLSKKLDDFAKERDWEKYHNPRNLLLAMMPFQEKACAIQPLCSAMPDGFTVLKNGQDVLAHYYTFIAEVGELSELFMWKGEVPRGLPGWRESEKEHLGEELSDVLLYLIRLSDMCGVDLGDAAIKKIVKNAVKYPAPSKSA